MTCLDSVMEIELISSIFFGLIVGAAAKLIMPGKDPGGIFVTILLGIAGAVLGGWVKTRLDYGPQEQAAGWIMSILGAVVILALYRVYLAKRSGKAS